jgi:hypothetical protein
VNFTASYHGAMDFVRPLVCEKPGGIMCPPEQIRRLFGFVALCQSLLHHESDIDSVSLRIGSEGGFERIGNCFLRLESSYQ